MATTQCKIMKVMKNLKNIKWNYPNKEKFNLIWKITTIQKSILMTKRMNICLKILKTFNTYRIKTMDSKMKNNYMVKKIPMRKKILSKIRMILHIKNKNWMKGEKRSLDHSGL